ncbi:hypothetical protein [Sphingomonas sp.]|uniref:hypothetical protein n=1 Tax=Sphingomonas sp. TaxID=28214 RepID=UPI0038A06C5A
MSRVEAAAAMDRLPWLPDEPPPRRARRRGSALVAPLMAIAVLVAGAAYWLGSGAVENLAPPTFAPSKPAATVRLPAAQRAATAQPQVKLAPTPEVEPIVAPPMPVIDTPLPVNGGPEKTGATSREVVESAAPAEGTLKLPNAARLEPWPVRVIEGADGRLVRVGAFSSVHRAKRGWWAIVRANPALKRLPALVVPVQPLRSGRVYYRLQMGTTSQAHSAVLCQRMRMIAQPCVVVGAKAQQ